MMSFVDLEKKLRSLSFKQRKGATLRVVEDPRPEPPDPMVEADKRLRNWMRLAPAQDLLDELQKELRLIRHEADANARDHLALVSALRAERTVMAFINMIEEYRRPEAAVELIAGEPDAESVI